MIHRHSTTSLKDGSLHQLAIPMWGREIIFDDDPPIVTDYPVHSGWSAVDGQGVKWAVCVLDGPPAGPGGFLLIANDGRLQLRLDNLGGGGLGFAALRPLPVGVEVYLLGRIVSETEAIVSVRNTLGVETRTFVCPRSSMGFLQIRGETDVVMVHVGTTKVAYPGVMFWYCHDEKGWTAGVVEKNPPGGQQGTVGLITPSGVLLLASLTHGWDGYVNLPPHLAVSGDGQTALVAIPSGERVSPPPDEIVWVEYQPEAPSIAPYDEPKAIGPYYGSSEQYGYHEYPGNCDVLLGPNPTGTWPASDFNKMKIKRPIIAGAGALNIPDDMLIGWGGDPEYPYTLRPDKPAFWYTDVREYQDHPAMRDWDVRQFQAYPSPGESPEAFERSVAAQLDRFSGRKMIVAAFYTRLGTIDPLLYMPAYDHLLRRADVMGMLCFDYARSGIKFNHELEEWYNAFCQATPGLPDFSVPEPPKPPVKKGFEGLVYEYLSVD